MMMAADSFNRYVALALAAAILSACATERDLIPPPLVIYKETETALPRLPDTQREAAAMTQVTETPRPPVPGKRDTIKEPPPPAPPGGEKADITLQFDQLPLPNFRWCTAIFSRRTSASMLKCRAAPTW